jgi:hypothetical protein
LLKQPYKHDVLSCYLPCLGEFVIGEPKELALLKNATAFPDVTRTEQNLGLFITSNVLRVDSETKSI